MVHRPRRRHAIALLPALMLGSETLPGAPKLRSFVVDSQPPGAEVHTITGRQGVTPAFVSERDIYPNSYPADRQALYGKVILRRPGCAEYAKRITLDDIRQGLNASLECEPARETATRAKDEITEPESTARAKPESPAPNSQTLPRRRLHQLRVLEELHEEGLLSAEEERTIRRRILTAP